MKEVSEKKPRTRQTAEFKLKIAKMVKSRDDINRVAQETGILSSTVRLWFTSYKAFGESHFLEAPKPVGRGQLLWNRVERLEKRLAAIETDLGIQEKR